MPKNNRSNYSPAVRLTCIVLTVLVASSAVVWLAYMLINLFA